MATSSYVSLTNRDLLQSPNQGDAGHHMAKQSTQALVSPYKVPVPQGQQHPPTHAHARAHTHTSSYNLNHLTKVLPQSTIVGLCFHLLNYTQ